MRSIRSLLLFALLMTCFGADAFGQGYYQSYGSSYYFPGYNNSYHGYWRDQGYGFSSRPVYGSYYYSQGYLGNPYYGASPYYGRGSYYSPGFREYGGPIGPYGHPNGYHGR